MRRLSAVLLLLFIFTIPWQTAIGGRNLYILFLAFVTTVLACILQRRFVRPPVFVFLVGAFILWQMVTVYWSIDVETTVGRLFSMAPMLALVWSVAEHGVDDKERYLMLQAYVVGCLVLCGLLVKAYLGGESGDPSRYAPTAFSVNESADMLAAGIAVALLSINMRRKGPFFWVNLGFLPLALVAVVLTGSRSGFLLSALAMMGVFYLLWRTKLLYRMILLLVFVGVFTGLFFAVSADSAMEASLKRVTFSADTAGLKTLTNRTVIWGAGVEVFKKHPFGGVGAGNFNRSVQGTLGVPWSAHSIFVQTAAEEGVVGLALLGALLLAAIGPVWKRRARGFLLHTLLFLVLVGTTAVANFVTLYSLWFGLALVAVGGAASAPAGRVAAAQAEVSGETRRGVLRIGTAEDWG